MSRTYRDIRRARYRRFVGKWYIDKDVSTYGAHVPRDLLVEGYGLEHHCSPYCLHHWNKRVDKRKARQRLKAELRNLQEE